jgi:hypothetical protein
MHIWREAAEKLGCDIATIKAVFEVEAAGRFFDSDGKLPQRFEPHHFPREHWPRIGFHPGSVAPWRASLKIKESKRKQMFDTAQQIDTEAAYDATSWGAPQVMGFNAHLCGYKTAVEMVDAFEKSADNQIRAFVSFLINTGLSTHLRSQDWFAFAAGYNGSGQAATYAGKIESAYRRHSGGLPSATVLRVGSKGEAVRQLQERLNTVGFNIPVDGDFGARTLEAVRNFQRAEGLKIDGIAGAKTQAALERKIGERIVPPPAEQKPTAEQNLIDKVLERAPVIVGSSGVAGLLGSLNENAQTLVVSAVVLASLGLLLLYILRKGVS